MKIASVWYITRLKLLFKINDVRCLAHLNFRRMLWCAMYSVFCFESSYLKDHVFIAIIILYYYIDCLLMHTLVKIATVIKRRNIYIVRLDEQQNPVPKISQIKIMCSAKQEL